MAEGAPDDALLLQSAESATAGDGVPATIGRLRRRRLLHHDALSTTWEAWDIQTGQPAWLRVLRPRWREVPAMVRRFLGKHWRLSRLASGRRVDLIKWIGLSSGRQEGGWVRE